ncbi:uncharacterized protein LOC117650399 [Thrips palmi]|uniref:Uncharacterized protein LOC117650399 n=1 Tax=Thrips palmi TaxID=161013 RepID=A0A6P8ZWF0_THRPL|nr:uncharacterized protein LOC117650399 [Thrips palmi]XP_034249708.1 uncharacterized protein LOC117650399 [Thrips palmi]
MGIYCASCEQRISGGIDAFEKHLQRHASPFICCEGDCQRRKFAVKSSLYRHLRDHHIEECDSSSDSSSASSSASSASSSATCSESSSQESDQSHEGDDSTSSSDNVDDNTNGNNINSSEESIHDVTEEIISRNEFDISLERAAARLILDLLKRGNVTGTAVSVVIEESQLFVSTIVDVVKKEIATNLKNKDVEDGIIQQCVNNVSASEPFKFLKTKDQQQNYFEKNFGLVKRQPEFLGYRDDHKVDSNGVSIPTQVRVNFQYVSVTKMLTAVLNNKVLHKLIHSEKKSTDGKIRSFLDGSLAATHPLISEYPFTIRITLHTDDFDTPNPLGSKTGIHKISEINYQLQNLPAEENARLRSVFVMAYAYKEDLPVDGIGAMLDPFFLEMEQLETADGVEINVNGRPYTLRATLVAGAADDLAAHEALGLYSPSCRRFCSICTILKKDFYQDIFAQGELRTKELHQFHLRELLERSEEFMKANYGVQLNAALQRRAKYAEFPEALIKDGMHDLLKGVVPMEIKLALHEFCFVKKYFDVFYFNHRIATFNYGPGDSNNKPSPNFTIASVENKGCYTLHQTAAQTWCLLQVFPFLVGDKVPLDNPHLRLIVHLKCICRVIFSHVLAESDFQELDTNIYDHHKLFFTLYPPTEEPPAAAAVDVDAAVEEDEDNPEENEDFLQDPVELLVDGHVTQEENNNPGDEAGHSTNEPKKKQKKKKPKKIRPLHKHHHLLHYIWLMRKFGPAVLYWCMRYEGKHALAKRFGTIVCNHKNLPVSFLDIQQMYQCAELMDLDTEVLNEIFISKGSLKVAGECPHFNALSVHGINEEEVLEEVTKVEIAGFLHQEGLYVNLQLADNDNAPLFGRICNIYVHNENVYLITKDFKGVYDSRFDAFLIESEAVPLVRALLLTDLFLDKPMTAWTVNSESFYLSPRRCLAEALMQNP